MDETYVKVRGKWTYLYRAVDKFGNTIDFYLSPARNAKGLADAIAGSRTEMIKDNGHFMMVERPDETLAALRTIV